MTVQHDAGRSLAITQQSSASLKWKLYPAHIQRALGMVPRVNKSGGDVVSGDVLVDDVTTERGMTSTTTAGDLRRVFVVPKLIDSDESVDNLTIVSNDEDWVYAAGAYVQQVNCDTTAVGIGEYLKTSATAKKATGTGTTSAAGTPPPPGSFAIALSAKAGGSNGTVSALMLGDTAGGIGGRKVAITAPTHGQALKYHTANAQWEPGISGALLSSGTEVAISNSSAETTLWSTTLPGGILGSTGFVIVRLGLIADNDTGGSVTCTFRFKYGGTTLCSPPMVLQNTHSLAGELIFYLRGDGATNAQEALGSMTLGTDEGGTNNYGGQGRGTAAIDSTAAQTLAITAQFASASASLTLKTMGAVVLGGY